MLCKKKKQKCIIGLSSIIFFYQQKKVLTCLLNTATSSLNESDEHTSPPATPGSRGVQVANSHFSNIRASRGKSGCLKREQKKKENYKSDLIYFF
jgi:hypothetical protein